MILRGGKCVRRVRRKIEVRERERVRRIREGGGRRRGGGREREAEIIFSTLK